METFDFQKKCQWTGGSFSVGDTAMYCLNCERVTKINSYQERTRVGKQLCNCNNPNLVEAVAANFSHERIRLEPNQSSSSVRTSTAGTEPLNFRDTSSNTPPRNPLIPNQNQRTGVNPSNINSNTSRTNPQPPTVHQPRTNSNTSSNSTNTNHWGWIAIVLIVAAAFLSPDIRGWVATQINQSTNNPIQNNQPPQLTPKEVITKYYQLAPSNRTEAKSLLSDALKAAHRENNPNSDGKSSFWDEIKSVETYSFKTEKESPSNHQIRVWLKYINKDSATSCESERVEVIFDSSKGQWLINKVYDDVEYNLDCGG